MSNTNEAVAAVVDDMRRATKRVGVFFSESIMEWANRLEAAAPRRNCDVGTVAEQGRRFFQHCASFYDCASCPVNTPQNTDVDCALAWAQMPYEADEAKGGAE